MSAKKKGRIIKLQPKAIDALEQQRLAFIDKFGREPGPSDPVFFDPDANTPQPISEEKINKEILDILNAMGAPPELIYAYKKTGFLLSEEGYANLTKEDREEYDDAIKEYFKLKGN